MRGRVETPLRAMPDGSLALLPPRVYLTSPAVPLNPATNLTLGWTADVLGETGVDEPGYGMWTAGDPTRVYVTDRGVYQATLSLATSAGTALRDRTASVNIVRGGVTIITVVGDSLSRADGGATVTHQQFETLALEQGDYLTVVVSHLMAAAVNVNAGLYLEKIGRGI